ncbi:MAG: DUF262 domain-containing protein, partial [Bdellovibrionales bacterium]
ILGKDVLDKHQKDVEIILRVFALVGALEKYEKPMKEFLNLTMKKHDEGDTKKVQKFFDIFPKVTKLVVTELGKKPFHLRGPLNVSALDSVMCILVENYAKLDQISIGERYKKLRASDEFSNLTQFGTTDKQTIQDRVKLVHNYLIG